MEHPSRLSSIKLGDRGRSSTLLLIDTLKIVEYRLIIDQSGILHLGIHFMIFGADFIDLLKHYGVVIFFKLDIWKLEKLGYIHTRV